MGINVRNNQLIPSHIYIHMYLAGADKMVRRAFLHSYVAHCSDPVNRYQCCYTYVVNKVCDSRQLPLSVV